MARYRATIDTPRERDDVFAYISDFSTTQEWDPGVVEAERLKEAAVGEGTEFRLVAEFLGRKTALTYRIVEYDPPHAVTFRGENATVISRAMSPAATEAIARVLVALGRIAFEHPEITAVDVNPLIVNEHGAVAVDALVVVGS